MIRLLPYRPPYDWPAMLRFLERRMTPATERIDGTTYRRSLRWTDQRTGAHRRGVISVADLPGASALQVHVSPGLVDVAPAVLARVGRMFDVGADPAAIAGQLGPLAAARPGLRLPGAIDPFELSVRAIIGQQITVAAARTLANRFVERFGEPLEALDALDDSSPRRLFPTATRIAGLRIATDADVPDPGTRPTGQPAIEGLSALGEIGIIRARGGAIIAIARALDRGTLTLTDGPAIDTTLAALTALPGIGPWTAHYIAMRALSWPDAFPPRDVAVLKAMGLTSPVLAAARAEGWRPWRSYAVLHLWASLG